MKGLKTISVIIVLSIISYGCYYDKEEEIYPMIDCVTSDMSYSSDILPILISDCYGCHKADANFGNVTLEGYEEVLKYVNNGSLLGSINHEGGYSPMPKNSAKLVDCELEKIAAWINDGAPNN